MSKRYEGASVRPQALVLSPEAAYPAIGGGALRTSSLIDYLARRYNIDVITFREDPADQRTFPADRVRDVLNLHLPHHSKSTMARAARNFRRFLEGKPPLVDRYSGFETQVKQWLDERVYSIVLVEHFWAARYAKLLRDHAERLVLDLHNIESVLQATTAATENWPLSMMFSRFAAAYENMEREWIPQFDDVLVPSADDSAKIVTIAPTARVIVYPNTIARHEQPLVPEEPAIVFSGNLEYHANVSAVQWFGSEIWPHIRQSHPEIEWRLIGKNSEAIHLRVPGMRIIGAVDDAIRAIAATQVAVVPLRSGSGTRFKILEAWAAGRPVVSTTLGAEGLGARGGDHLLIADDPVAFAAAVNLLLADDGMRRRLGANGRKLYLERFTTEAGWRVLDSELF